MIPLALLIAALGYLLSGWLRRPLGKPLIDGLPLWDTLGVTITALVALSLASMLFVSKDLAG